MRFKTSFGGRLVLAAALSLAALVATVPASADATSVWKLGYYTQLHRELTFRSARQRHGGSLMRFWKGIKLRPSFTELDAHTNGRTKRQAVMGSSAR